MLSVPQRPSNASVLQIENISVLLEWVEGHTMGEAITNHTITITESQSDYADAQGSIIVDPVRYCHRDLCNGPDVTGITRKFLVTGLKPLSHYTFSVVSINANGASVASGSADVRTKGRKFAMQFAECGNLALTQVFLFSSGCDGSTDST
jgi:hypothetical protein